MSRTLCVMGMHRSGTSLLMQMLNHCGVNAGEAGCLAVAGGMDNPSGYWEHPEFRKLNDRILEELGGSWKAVPPVEPRSVERLANSNELGKRARALVDRFAACDSWGWKDPRNSLTFPFWRHILPELRAIILLRNPLQVAMSMQARRMRGNRKYSVSFQAALELWLFYYECILSSVDVEVALVVHYETLLHHPAAELRRLGEWLNLELDESAVLTAASRVRPELFRNAVSDAVLHQVDLPERLVGTYEKLCRFAGSGYRVVHLDQGSRATADVALLYRKLVDAWAEQEAIDEHAADPGAEGLTHPDAAGLEDVEVVVVHYAQVRPTVAMLTALFRHYPEARVTLVDNSGGACSVKDLVFPHVQEIWSRLHLLVNPATDRGATGGLSHGAGIDLARRQCQRRYLLSMEPDTFVLQRGCIEFALALMQAGYDWAGVGQKPIDGQFASFSPSFAIFRVELLQRYDLSFRRRERTSEEHDPKDLLIRHHEAAAEAARRGLPLSYPEGKPPDTYRRPREQIVAIEEAHKTYYDTGEWVHRALTDQGHRGYLFAPLSTCCHTWGSRDEALFLRNFRHNLPNVDVNQFLPPALQVATSLRPVSLNALEFVDHDTSLPRSHWSWQGGASRSLAVDRDGLRVEVETGEEGKVYLAMGAGSFNAPPPESLEARLDANVLCEVTCALSTPETLCVELWVIEYGRGERLKHHICRRAVEGKSSLEFVTTPSTDRFRVLFRFAGKGTAQLGNLVMHAGVWP